MGSEPEPVAEPRSGPGREVSIGRRALTRGAALGALCALFGVVVGTEPLHDNSFLTHLATGRLILDGHFPHSDPYTFTAHGEPWVVQSWLASVAYATADRLAGGNGIRVLVAALSSLLGLLVWRLSRPGRTISARVLAVAATLVAGGVGWGSRPLLFGLVCFALTIVIVEERRDPRWLIPLLWVWANCHGSFPLGLVLIAVGALGRRLDGDDAGPDLRALAYAALGCVLAVANPTGIRLLIFPIELLQRQKVLSAVTEWQAPTFTSLSQRLFLLQAMAVVVLLPRLRARHRYRSGLLFVVFFASALLGSRNITLATLVFVPILARELRDLGSLRSDRRAVLNTAFVGLLGVAAVAALFGRLSATEPFDLTSYPIASIDRLEEQGLLTPEHRLATRDFVGNYLEFRTGGSVPVFVDDRVDMLPESLVADEGVLLSGGRTWDEVLDKWKIETVIWEREKPLASLLMLSDDWERVAVDKSAAKGSTSEWWTFRRVGTDAG